ncbi:hypothetical protein GBF35_15645 [Nonomuraea phyllanthi]|uniref:hypothetical protein n=1 Tax=Nonomuraea phyllanthi TaxID=2219224 RepID=UPI001292DCFF|nr:hypothetical protein [Nonomuraea phyllanthi]QFY07925.1 hypothetical protein GBF35_15645 [Nonomuraea phyllanthi]
MSEDRGDDLFARTIQEPRQDPGRIAADPLGVDLPEVCTRLLGDDCLDRRQRLVLLVSEAASEAGNQGVGEVAELFHADLGVSQCRADRLDDLVDGDVQECLEQVPASRGAQEGAGVAVDPSGDPG